MYTLNLSGNSQAWNSSWPYAKVTILGQEYKGLQSVQFEENTPVNLVFSTSGSADDSVCYLNGIEVARANFNKNNPATYSFILVKDTTIAVQFSSSNRAQLRIAITN